MKTAFLTLFVICSSFYPILTSFSQGLHHHENELRDENENDTLIPCIKDVRIALEIAANELAERDNDEPRDIRIEAMNGLQYESTRNMANIALIVDMGAGKYRYGIFHIHFTNSGVFLRTEGTEKKLWRDTWAPDNWKNEWCDLIRGTYPDETKTQKC